MGQDPCVFLQSHRRPSPKNGFSEITDQPPISPLERPFQRASMRSPFPSFVTSFSGAMRVFGYHPAQGGAGTNITAAIAFQPTSRETTHLRLVLGPRALTTSVRCIPEYQDRGMWEISASVPLAGAHVTSPIAVNMTIQALNSREEILDSATFGQFMYIPDGREGDLAASSACRPISHIQKYASQPALPQPYHALHSPPPSHLAAHPEAPPKRRSLIRTRRPAAGADDEERQPQCVTLSFLTSIESMAKDWDSDELAASRRLVRFTSTSTTDASGSGSAAGSTLNVSCEAIKPAQYAEGDTVVSCIYRADMDSCFVTSVDILFLLERVLGQTFDIEEKNRIRRNLEGFRPKTVSKNRPDCAEFFALIMSFPTPKPRNIEKDVKVFEWEALSHALEKIVGRFIFPTPCADAVLPAVPSLRRSLTPASRPSSSIDLALPGSRGGSRSGSPGSYSEQTSYAQASLPSRPPLLAQGGMLHELEIPPSALSAGSYGMATAFSSATSTPMLTTPTHSNETASGAIVDLASLMNAHATYTAYGCITPANIGPGFNAFMLDPSSMKTFDSLELQTLQEYNM